MNKDVRALRDNEIHAVSGGMKWDHNYVSKDVIDARGGQFYALGYTFTLDINGNVSSATKD
jgi:hypothetical protein